MYRGGTDSSCGGGGDSNGALRAGTLTKAELIASSQRSLRVLFALGLANSEEERPYKHLGKADIGSEASRQLNLEAARQSIVSQSCYFKPCPQLLLILSRFANLTVREACRSCSRTRRWVVSWCCH